MMPTTPLRVAYSGNDGTVVRYGAFLCRVHRAGHVCHCGKPSVRSWFGAR